VSRGGAQYRAQYLEAPDRSIGQVDAPTVRLDDGDMAHRIAVGVTWAIVVVLVAITLNALTRGLIRLVRGLLDAGREDVVRGTVVRRRTWPRQRGTESVEINWVACGDGPSE